MATVRNAEELIKMLTAVRRHIDVALEMAHAGSIIYIIVWREICVWKTRIFTVSIGTAACFPHKGVASTTR